MGNRKPMTRFAASRRAAPLFVPVVFAIAGCSALPVEPPQSDVAPTTQALKKLPRKQGERVAVTIYEFRSGLNEISSRAATDMFKTALVNSGQFRVVERARVSEGVMREKQINAQGLSTGNAARQPLGGARYVFEGTLSEANSGEVQRSGDVNIGGMQIGGGSSRDSIAIDVRIVDAASGEVVDAITIRKSLRSDAARVSGVGNLIGTVMAQRGRSSPYTPDVQASQSRREGVDSALRAAIDQAVLELAKRFEP